MKIVYSRRLMDHFRRTAKAMYPREAYAALLSKVIGETCQIDMVYIPDDQEKWSSESGLAVPQRVWDKAQRIARKVGLVFAGDIHSHPFPSSFKHDCSPSDLDWTRAREARLTFHGICSIRKHPDGRLTTRIKFWPRTAELKERITE